MIAPTGSTLSSGFGFSTRALGVRGWILSVDLTGTVARRPAPRSQPRRVAGGLEGLLTDGAAVRQLASSRAAAQAFAAGDGFLVGQMIDRSI